MGEGPCSRGRFCWRLRCLFSQPCSWLVICKPTTDYGVGRSSLRHWVWHLPPNIPPRCPPSQSCWFCYGWDVNICCRLFAAWLLVLSWRYWYSSPLPLPGGVTPCKCPGSWSKGCSSHFAEPEAH